MAHERRFRVDDHRSEVLEDAWDEDHGDRTVRLRRRPARIRVPQGHHRRGHRRLGRDLRLAHVGVARDGARGHGPAAHRRGSAADRAHERADLVRRPARRPGADEGPRRDRPRALGHQGEVAGRAGLRAARRPVPRPHPAVLVALRDVPGGLARGRRPAADAHLRRVGGRRARRRRPRASRSSRRTSSPRAAPDGRATLPALPRRRDRPPDDRRRGRLDRHAARRRRARRSGSPSTSSSTTGWAASSSSRGRSSRSTCTGWRSRASTPTRCSPRASRRSTRLCHGESLIRREQFRPFFQQPRHRRRDDRDARQRPVRSRAGSPRWPSSTTRWSRPTTG